MYRASGGFISDEKLLLCFDSLKQHIKRANYQAAMWKRSLECNPIVQIRLGMAGQKTKMVSTLYGMNALLHQMKYCIFHRVVAQRNAKSELVHAQTMVCSAQIAATLASVKIY